MQYQFCEKNLATTELIDNIREMVSLRITEPQLCLIFPRKLTRRQRWRPASAQKNCSKSLLCTISWFHLWTLIDISQLMKIHLLIGFRTQLCSLTSCAIDCSRCTYILLYQSLSCLTLGCWEHREEESLENCRRQDFSQPSCSCGCPSKIYMYLAAICYPFPKTAGIVEYFFTPDI